MAPQAERPTEHFRHEHEHLMHHLDTFRQTLDRMRQRMSQHEVNDLSDADGFFQNMLKPHAHWEEMHLYPVADRLIKQYNSKATETMEVDHVDLVARIDEFSRLLSEVSRAGNVDASDERVDRLRRLGYQIDAILLLHFRKEEDVYLRLVDEHMSREDVEKILGEHHGGHAH